jgi:hypothetical protein
MPAAVESFYRYALNTSQESGVFYRDDRRDAKDFVVSKNTITTWVRFLEKEVWFIPRRSGRARLRRNRATGKFDSIPYQVLDHDAWTTRHPGSCRYMLTRELARTPGKTANGGHGNIRPSYYHLGVGSVLDVWCRG